MTYTHPELDGAWNRLIGSSIIESRDPNDGQSSDPRDKSRHQYTLVNGILLARVLPPESVGERWRDPATGKFQRRAPAWESIDVPAEWPLVADWIEHVTGDTPRPWSMGGVMAFAEGRNPISSYDADGRYIGGGYDREGNRLYQPVTMVWMRALIEVHGTSWPQQVACPHCQDWIVWAEAGYVPGWRICRGCHRHWQITLDSGTLRGWRMRRVNYPRFWPYAEVQ